MTDGEHDIFLQPRLTSKGADYIIKNHKLVKWLFGFSLLISISVFINYVLLFYIYHTDENAANTSVQYSSSYIIEAKLIPLLGMTQAFLFIYGSYCYYKFSSETKRSVSDVSEENFNSSFKYIFRFSLISIIQSCLGLFVAVATTLFIFRRIMHNL